MQAIDFFNEDLIISMRLSENAHLLRYPHPSSLQRTFMYASFLGISAAPVPPRKRDLRQAGSKTERDFAKLNLHLDIFHQPQKKRVFRQSQWEE
jgi:hypothetical protein